MPQGITPFGGANKIRYGLNTIIKLHHTHTQD